MASPGLTAAVSSAPEAKPQASLAAKPGNSGRFVSEALQEWIGGSGGGIH